MLLRSFAAAVLAALLTACSEPSGPVISAFSVADCQGRLVTVDSIGGLFPLGAVTGSSNILAVEGETLFVGYSTASSQIDAPRNGGIVALPVSGGPVRVVAAAEAGWVGVSDFWVRDGQVSAQRGNVVVQVPVDATTPGVVPTLPSDPLYSAYAHDAEFGYFAHPGAELPGIILEKTPLGGGAPVVLLQEGPPNAQVAAMTDAGDALLVLVRWYPYPDRGEGALAALWRVPKDGSPRSDVRADVDWGNGFLSDPWLAWEGDSVIGPVRFGNNIIVPARVALTGTTPPQYLKLGAQMATRRGDEVLTAHLVYPPEDHEKVRLMVASSQGAPEGTPVACSEPGWSGWIVGLAANETGVYVASYRELANTITIERVSP